MLPLRTIRTLHLNPQVFRLSLIALACVTLALMLAGRGHVGDGGH